MNDPDIQPTLSGRRVTLAPLRADHRADLLAAAGDGELWDLKVTTVPGAGTVDAYIETALAGRQAGSVLPFVVTVEGTVIGSTRFWKVDRGNRTAEIGHSWIAASWQRTFANTEAKLLLLRHAFEAMGLVRVQFQTDELNARSRAAILRLGAREEGLLRNERIMPDGRRRNSVIYSIIDSEWPSVERGLVARLGHDR